MVTIAGVLRYGIGFNVLLGVFFVVYLCSEHFTAQRRFLELIEEEARCLKNGSVPIRSIWFSGMLKKGETWVSNLPRHFRERFVDLVFPGSGSVSSLFDSIE